MPCRLQRTVCSTFNVLRLDVAGHIVSIAGLLWVVGHFITIRFCHFPDTPPGCRLWPPRGRGGHSRGKHLPHPRHSLGGQRRDEPRRIVPDTAPIVPAVVAAGEDGPQVQRHLAVARQQWNGELGEGVLQFPRSRNGSIPEKGKGTGRFPPGDALRYVCLIIVPC